MKRWKQYLMIFAVLVFMMIGSQAVMATESGTTSDGFKWIYEDGEMAIVAYKGTSSVVDIPSVIDGKEVTRIHDKAFCKYNQYYPEYNDNLNSITKVIIPNTVKSVGSRAFSGLYNLKSIIIPNSVTKIENIAFENCSCYSRSGLSMNKR